MSTPSSRKQEWSRCKLPLLYPFYGLFLPNLSLRRSLIMALPSSPAPHRAPWREKWNVIIFGHDTFAGHLFDLLLLIAILLSVLVVLLDSVRTLRDSYG